MNEFDNQYDIRRARIEDIPLIMRFIDEHWRKGHVMAVDRELFEYEYVHGEEVDFVIAIKKETQTLEAIFGFLRCSSDPHGDIWGSMWKVNDQGSNMNLLGVELARRVLQLTGFRSHIGNGANPKTTIPLRKVFFREHTGKMKQYYILNSETDEYHIAVVNEPWTSQGESAQDEIVVRELRDYSALNAWMDCAACTMVPQKDNWYIKHRFYDHPVYDYNVYGVENSTGSKSVFVTREICVNGGKVLRIVDYIGDHSLIRGFLPHLNRMMHENGYEYIDFFEYGIEDDIMLAGGFRDREAHDNIIPNYFEPFCRENVDIWVHYKDERTTFFKADGDQDRPNSVRR